MEYIVQPASLSRVEPGRTPTAILVITTSECWQVTYETFLHASATSPGGRDKKRRRGDSGKKGGGVSGRIKEGKDIRTKSHRPRGVGGGEG